MNELQRRLYVPNFDHWSRQCSKKFFSMKELGARSIANGIVLPARPIKKTDPYRCRGGVCDRDLNFVAGYNNMPPGQKNGAYCLDEAYPIERAELEQSGEEVIYGGVLVFHFGHFISECLSRMWYVVDNPNDRRKVVFIQIKTSKLQTLGAWVYQMLDLLGLPEDRVVFVEKPTQFKSIVVPDQSARIKFDYTSKYLTPFRRITQKVRPLEGAKKIFLTRGKDLPSAMTLVNQEYFERFYRVRGFKVIAPEQLSLVDQIALISGADEVATFLGTLAHWSLFSRAGVKWTMLTRVDGIISRQCLINDAVGIDWYIVSTAMNFLYAEQGGGVCLIGSTDHWKRFVFDHFNQMLDPTARLPLSVVDEYIERWCKYFASDVKKRADTLKKLHDKITAMEEQLHGRK